MSNGHISLAPYVDSAEELYELLQAGHLIHEVKVARWAWGMLIAAVLGLALPGAFGKVAWMACLYSGMNWLVLIVDYVGRGWFMHMLSLREHLVPEPLRMRDDEAIPEREPQGDGLDPAASVH